MDSKANFSLSVTATFQPECSPPMTVAYTDITVTDTTDGISKSIPGTFQVPLRGLIPTYAVTTAVGGDPGRPLPGYLSSATC